VITTPVAAPAPEFEPVIVYVRDPGACTVSVEALFVTDTFGHCTTMLAVLLLLAALVSTSPVAVMVAVLLIPLAQSAAVLVLVMVTVAESPDAIVPKLQVSV
jgi:hypothetical protein